MPIYLYHCEECEQEFEALLSIKEMDNFTCPHNNDHHVKRLLTTANHRYYGGPGQGFSKVNIKADF